MTNLLEIGLTNAVLATVLGLGVWLVTRFWRQPVFVHALWVIVLLKLVTPPIVSVPWRWSQPSTMSAPHSDAVPNLAEGQADFAAPTFAVVADAELTTPAISEALAASPVQLADMPMESQAPDLSRPALSWVAVVAAAWLAGSVLFLTMAVGRLLRFHTALHDAASAPGELSKLAADVAERFGIAGGYRLRVTDGRLPPLVWPIGQPTIVLSRQLLAELSPDETQTLLAHEFAHLRRKDHWVRWLELVAATMYWWHPVVWWARTMIRRTEEQACDAWVVWAFPGTTKRYASALFTAIEFISDSRPAAPLVASRLDAGGQLKERIENVMSGKLNHRLSVPIRVSLLLVAVAILPLSLRAVQAADEEAATQNGPNDAKRTTEVPLPKIEPQIASTADGSIARRLETPVAVQFIDMPLEEAVHNLSDAVGVDIYIDPRGLDEEGISIDAPVTVQLKNKVSLKSALNLMLKPLQLTYVIEDEVIKVTTEQFGAASRTGENYRIAPGELLTIRAVGISPDAPIADVFVVEPGGTVALGPLYGRVKVAGLTIEEAEKATLEHFQKQFKEPVVQITVGRGQRDGAIAVNEQTDLPSRNAPPRRTVAQRPVTLHDEANQEEQEVLREHALFLEERFKAIDAKFQTGSPGGSQDVRDMTGYEMATAQAQLALAAGRLDEAAARLQEAGKFAESGLQAAKANYEAGRITNDMVLQAAKNMAESKRRILQIRESQTSATGQPPRTSVDGGEVRQESARSAPQGDSNLSIGVVKKLVEGQKQNYERLQALAKKNIVSASELEKAKNEYEAQLAWLEQAQRALKYNQLLVELAETEYQEAAEKNRESPDAVSKFELRKLQLKVELAKAKLNELAE